MNSQNVTNELTHSSFALPAFKAEYEGFRDEFVTLLNNGLFYQSTGNAPGAAISYSMAETYLHIIKGRNGFEGPVDALEQQLLGYIEVLTERTKNLVRSGGAAGKKDEKEDWESVCSDLKAETSDKTFADIIGMANAKQLVITSFIKPLLLPNLFPALGKGVLLFGPPGTGKTYLAKGMISELSMTDPSVGVIFFAPTGADLKGKYVGETEKRITKYFTCAARAACAAMDTSVKAGKPKKYVSVLFIDEFDSIAGDRSADETGLMANSVNTLLQMMDGVQSFKNVTVVAGTNYPWKLDAAILRRFNNQIYINVPQYEDIVELIKYTYKDSIAIKSSNVWCYCAGKQMESVYKATQSMDALCGSELTTKDVKYNAALMRFEITLPSNVTFRHSAQKSITKTIEQDEEKPHYHINVCIVGQQSRLFKFEFVLDGVSINRGSEWLTAEMITDTPEEKAKFETLARARPGKARGGGKTAKMRGRSVRQTLKAGRTMDEEIQAGGVVEPKTLYRIYIKLDKAITETVDRETIFKYFQVIKTQVKTKDIEYRLPYKLFDLEFLRSPIIEEVAQLMFEKKYSNSDIANVMTYVAQQSGQKAAALGSYIRWSQPTPEGYNVKTLCSDPTQLANSELSKYYISAMSVFKNKDRLDAINTQTVATLNLKPIIDASTSLLQAQKALATVKASNPKAEELKEAKATVKAAQAASELGEKLYHRFYLDSLSKVYSAKVSIEGKNYINCKFLAGIHLADMFIDDEKNDVYISEDLVSQTTSKERDKYLKKNPTQIVFIRKRMEFTNRVDSATTASLDPSILLFELTKTIDNFTVSFLKDYNADKNDNSLGAAMSKDDMIRWIDGTKATDLCNTDGTCTNFQVNYNTLLDRLYELANLTSETDMTAKAESKRDLKKTHALTLIGKIMAIIETDMKPITDPANQTLFNGLKSTNLTSEELKIPTQLFILHRMFQAEKSLLELGGISEQSTIVMPEEIEEFTRTGDLYIGAEINLNSPWYKTVARNNALYLNELALGKTSAILAFGGLAAGAGAFAAYVNMAAIPAWLSAAGVSTAAGTVATAAVTGVTAVGAAVVASPFIAAAAAVGGLAAIATAVKAYKSYDRHKPSAISVPPEATQAVEAYLKNQKVTALQFLVGRTKYIAFQETDSSGLPIKELEAFTLRTNIVGGPGVKSSKSSPINFIESMNVLSYMMTLRDLYSKDEYGVNPSFLAFYKVVKSNVFAIKGIKKDDPFGVMLTKLYADAQNIMYQSGFQVDQYSLTELKDCSVQKHQYTNEDVDKSSLLNFHMSAGLLKQALNEFQSTYNGQLGGWLQQYESNRSKFIEDRVWIKK